MAIIDIFSKRLKRLKGEVPDVYQYTDIPNILRVQIVHIVKDAFGEDIYGCGRVYDCFGLIHNLLSREYGVFSLRPNSNSDFDAVFEFFLNCNEYEKVLDIIELTFRMIDMYVRKQDYQRSVTNIKCTPDDAIDELNFRFKEHGVGYQYESGALVRVDSQFLHAEAVKPVLNLLGSEKRFKSANEEFLKAHEHYRHKRYKECLVDALKAFESVMKIICHKHGWQYNQNDTAQKLIKTCFDNDLIPSYLESQFSGLRATLESGIATLRNKVGGHGQGVLTIEATETIAGYALHLTAANILFLVKLEKEKFS